jgi:hypothetical protein
MSQVSGGLGCIGTSFPKKRKKKERERLGLMRGLQVTGRGEGGSLLKEDCRTLDLFLSFTCQ